MNNVKAICGHFVIAIGSPGSYQRHLCESKPCEECASKCKCGSGSYCGVHKKYKLNVPKSPPIMSSTGKCGGGVRRSTKVGEE